KITALRRLRRPARAVTVKIIPTAFMNYDIITNKRNLITQKNSKLINTIIILLRNRSEQFSCEITKSFGQSFDWIKWASSNILLEIHTFSTDRNYGLLSTSYVLLKFKNNKII